MLKNWLLLLIFLIRCDCSLPDDDQPSTCIGEKDGLEPASNYKAKGEKALSRGEYKTQYYSSVNVMQLAALCDVCPLLL